MRTNEVWKDKTGECLRDYDVVSSPRGSEVREVINGTYTVDMPSFIDLSDRRVNVEFMFAEAAWIISGSNRLEDLTPYMKRYADYSDDGVFLRGAYGPKVVDQLGYVVDSIEKDQDTRQAVLTIWRERPGEAKDIPCTVAMQFLLRDNKLNLVTTMRSQDIVLGFTYDVFTFSMVAKSVQLLLRERGIDVEMGKLFVNAGSMHIYERHYEQAEEWLESQEVDESIARLVEKYIGSVATYSELITSLKRGAEETK